jgi:hypothetical protein
VVNAHLPRYLLTFSGDAYGTPRWTWLAHGDDVNRLLHGMCAPLVAEALRGVSAVGFEVVAAALYAGGRPRRRKDLDAFAEYFAGYTRSEWDVLHGQRRVMNYIASVTADAADAATVDYLSTLYAK